MEYKLGSLFDGSGGFPLAGSLCGVVPVWAAEVEPYPIAVTRSRFPDMRHLGDISKVNGGEIEPVDIITFGSPCQDLSVAGKRAGLKHEANGDEETTRSGLFMEAVRIIKEMREATNGEYPTFALWENVPGAFSSNKGEDFRIVLEELIKIVEPKAVMPEVPSCGWAYADSYCGDGWSLAYRVFDAQYWGVPQRRRRIHLILDLRGQRAREVLFEREGVRGYFTQGRTPWQGLARDAQDCTGADDREGEGFDGYNGDLTGDVSATLGVNCGVSTGRNGVIERRGDRGLDAVAFEPGIAAREGGHVYEGVSGTLRANAGDNRQAVAYTLKIRSGVAVDSSGKAAGKGALVQTEKAATLAATQDQYLFQPMAYSFDSLASNSMKSSNPHSGCRQVETAKTLDTSDQNPSKNQGGIAIVELVPDLLLDDQGGRQISVRTDEKAPTLRAETHGNTPCVVARVYDARGNGDGRRVNTITGDHNNRITDYSSIVVSSKEPVYCLQGNGIDRADTAGCNDKGWKEDTCYTLTYGLDRASFNQGANAKYDFSVLLEQQPTMTARGPGAVCAQYIVRRLTPTECARLQGFADRWGDIDKKDTFTTEEFEFWHEVRNTHAAINGKQVKDYTEKQMLTWYNKLHTDSAEYKMWGNGIALPPALYCLQGITEALDNSGEEDDDAWMN